VCTGQEGKQDTHPTTPAPARPFLIFQELKSPDPGTIWAPVRQHRLWYPRIHPGQRRQKGPRSLGKYSEIKRLSRAQAGGQERRARAQPQEGDTFCPMSLPPPLDSNEDKRRQRGLLCLLALGVCLCPIITGGSIWCFVADAGRCSISAPSGSWHSGASQREEKAKVYSGASYASPCPLSRLPRGSPRARGVSPLGGRLTAL
jgi:hypothetical protein